MTFKLDFPGSLSGIAFAILAMFVFIPLYKTWGIYLGVIGNLGTGHLPSNNFSLSTEPQVLTFSL